jgi:hypothetical protein
MCIVAIPHWGHGVIGNSDTPDNALDSNSFMVWTRNVQDPCPPLHQQGGAITAIIATKCAVSAHNHVRPWAL